VDVHVEQVRGKDLCIACVADFDEWIAAGSNLNLPEKLDRAGMGRRFTQVQSLCAVHGHVTSKILSAATSMSRSSANWYLHEKAKRGHLTFHGKGVFTLVERVPVHPAYESAPAHLVSAE
jgi:hypothetical protein